LSCFENQSSFFTKRRAFAFALPFALVPWAHFFFACKVKVAQPKQGSLAYALGDFWAFALPLLLAKAGRLGQAEGKEKVRPFCLCVATVTSKGRHKLLAFCLCLPFASLALCAAPLPAVGCCPPPPKGGGGGHDPRGGGHKLRCLLPLLAFCLCVAFCLPCLCVGRLLPLQRKEKVRPFCLCVFCLC
jgi:hypothetical protein